jgi:hypothetical protein
LTSRSPQRIFTLGSFSEQREKCVPDVRDQGSVLVALRRAAKGWQVRLRQGYGAQSSLFGLPAEASAKAGKMYTFVSAISSVESRYYAEFMPTFVYLPEKVGPPKSRT